MTSACAAALRTLEEQVRRSYRAESSAHDFSHLQRVARLAARLARAEGGSLDVVIAASYLHDLHRSEERVRGHRVPATECDAAAVELLRAAGMPPSLEEPILAAIHYTEAYSFAPGGRGPAALDSRIVRDADNLDALGAIGVARAFVYGAHLGEPLWAPAVPRDPGPYTAGAPCPSVLHHFHAKLLRLRDDMDTPSGQRMAASRHRFMQAYVRQFCAEWGLGEDGELKLPA